MDGDGDGACAASPGVPRVLVHFRTTYMTRWGERVVVFGPSAQLGSWDVARGHALTCRHEGEELVWETVLSLPWSSSFVYRYAVTDEEGAVVKLDTEERRVGLPLHMEDCSAVRVFDEWQVRAQPAACIASLKKTFCTGRIAMRTRGRLAHALRASHAAGTHTQDTSNPAYVMSRSAFSHAIFSHRVPPTPGSVERAEPRPDHVIIRFCVWCAMFCCCCHGCRRRGGRPYQPAVRPLAACAARQPSQSPYVLSARAPLNLTQRSHVGSWNPCAMLRTAGTGPSRRIRRCLSAARRWSSLLARRARGCCRWRPCSRRAGRPRCVGFCLLLRGGWLGLRLLVFNVCPVCGCLACGFGNATHRYKCRTARCPSRTSTSSAALRVAMSGRPARRVWLHCQAVTAPPQITTLFIPQTAIKTEAVLI